MLITPDEQMLRRAVTAATVPVMVCMVLSIFLTFPEGGPWAIALYGMIPLLPCGVLIVLPRLVKKNTLLRHHLSRGLLDGCFCSCVAVIILPVLFDLFGWNFFLRTG